jgi:hypothetical protein
MSVCTLCGHPAFNGDALCSYHFASTGDDWATGNRIICDFLHRGILLPVARPRATPSAPPRRPLEPRGAETDLDERPLARRPPSMSAAFLRAVAFE